ncbi:alanine racemase [Actinomycetaceae bacterium MB13-C1-2]|nr:alanine racemase [Actinomycetaceae bacterium MB13-C1-2]
MLIDVGAKSFPQSLWGTTTESLRESAPGLDEFATPLVTLRREAIDHNTELLANWATSAGVSLCPHGKTSMAPALWQKMLDAGAWGITLATVWQAQVAATNGVPRIMIANEVTDGTSLDWATSQRQVDLFVWIDSFRGLRLIEQRRPTSPLSVLIDVGGGGGRTGTRTDAEFRALAQAVANSPSVRLCGIAGYEGALAHSRSAEDLATVRSYCERLAELYQMAEDLFEVSSPLISASGSVYYDVIAEELRRISPDAQIILRPGSFQIHDGGHYERLSPFGRDSEGPRLKTALEGWATVLSRPEPDLILLDGGRRDFGFDIDLPQIDAEDARLNGPAETFEINDQHLFVRVTPSCNLAVGDRVRLMLSHPCTSLDKWRLIPLVEDDRVIDAIETWF